MQRLAPRTLAVLVALGGAGALAFAHALAYWAELPPSALCLVERWPYRILIVLGLLAAIAPVRMIRFILVLAAVCLVADAAIAAVHVGVEFKWWPSPLPECAAPHFAGGSNGGRVG